MSTHARCGIIELTQEQVDFVSGGNGSGIDLGTANLQDVPPWVAYEASLNHLYQGVYGGRTPFSSALPGSGGLPYVIVTNP